MIRLLVEVVLHAEDDGLDEEGYEELRRRVGEDAVHALEMAGCVVSEAKVYEVGQRGAP